MEEELKKLKASVVSYKSANTKQREIIEELKKIIKEKDERIGFLVNELDAMTKARDAVFKDYKAIKEVNKDLKDSLDSNIEENKKTKHALEVLEKALNEARNDRDIAMQELIKSRRPWYKKIFSRS